MTVDDGQVRLVLFTHPGHEYNAKQVGLAKGEAEGLMPWKSGGSIHNRKFLEASGDAVDPSSGALLQNRTLRFWGEWEPPSRVRRLDRAWANWGVASLLHIPIWPETMPRASRQNTDPMVFGERFVYSNCRQGDKPVLRNLPDGSIIFFGRGSTAKQVFQVDTVLVVGEGVRMRAAYKSSTYGVDLVQDVVIGALGTEIAGPADGCSPGATKFLDEFVVYFGQKPTNAGLRETFSFFPTKTVEAPDMAFAKAEIDFAASPRLASIFPRVLQQGFKTALVDSATAADAWRDVVDQVAAQGFLLGTRAEPVRENADKAQAT